MLAEAVPFYKDLFFKRETTPSALSKIGSFIKHDKGPFSALAKPFDEEECLENFQAMHVGKSPGPVGLPIEFWNKTWLQVVSAFMLICNKAHVCMPQSWKQGQMRLIPKKDKPRTIGDARPITLLNVDHKMYSHMLAFEILWNRTAADAGWTEEGHFCLQDAHLFSMLTNVCVVSCGVFQHTLDTG